MSEKKEETRAKWQKPEIEDFAEMPEEGSRDEAYEKKSWCNPRNNGCRPMIPTHYPSYGMCNPRKGGCYPYKGPHWQLNCAPRQVCYPYVHFYQQGTYCRPYGFNYGPPVGSGCYPRR